MKKGTRAKKLNQETSPFAPARYRPLAVFGVVAAMVMGVGITAYAANGLLHGHVRFSERRNPPAKSLSEDRERNSSVKSPASSLGATSGLTDKYGAAASSPTVASAIRKAEAAVGAKNVEQVSGAKAAADRYEALEHGLMLPGIDPIQVIMHGYVPPGMPPRQAAMLYHGLPKQPMVSQPMTLEMADRMAGVPPDPMGGYQRIQAQNQQMFEGFMRERVGPVYVPPLHRDHNRVAQSATKNADGAVCKRDNQMGLIPAQYSYDGGSGPASVREMTNSGGTVVAEYGYDLYGRQTTIGGTGIAADFGYAGMYVHQPSGLSLAVHRAYSPNLGRWLNRDPIDDPTFSITPTTPEPNMVALGSASALPRAVSGLSQSNPYTYVANNPISFRDPLGLAPNVPKLPPPLYFDCLQHCARKLLIQPIKFKNPRNDIPGGCEAMHNCMQDCLSNPDFPFRPSEGWGFPGTMPITYPRIPYPVGE